MASKETEQAEIDEILKKQGLDRSERRTWLKSYRKEAKLA